MITKESIIGDVLKKYPKSAEVMFKHGLHCIGCHVSAYESIENGCKVHGMADKEIDALVKEINKV
ncbi:DUF1858 domain-containing protein, partial [Candidatus Woesearchaeota archaeon]|nr:DUF1858 domain-containing protein [Candidatus Woesearchaeota archaeon]